MNPPPPARPRAAPLLLLPGTLCDDAVFRPVLEALQTSSGASRGCTVETLSGGDAVETVAARILADAPARFALAGFSLGGIVALAIALAAPERVLGLCLINSNARDVPRGDRASRREEASRGAADVERHAGQSLWPRYVASAARGDETIRRAVMAMASRVGGQALMTQTDMALNRPDSRARLGALTMPALVLAGAEDALCPPPAQEEMARALPDAALALIPGAGHFSLLEKPAVAAMHLAAWLDRVDHHACGRPPARPC